ncbi:TPA: glutathione S-transferase family protein [Vibrio vulnificus]|nr:glutathione S-transferase [Vibrio vulnificus NBRC 15645 = ATCC 27562]EGQ7928996.1 glutathione S-transferase family protein [Vibrio vulnificus]EGQ7933389.1 glutathione S-transferase family protein [Vibrio vulnificus]EGQ8000264.1 glutathione S-transferase family protein [Vibrio vulnificus]EGQ9281374.1 glutathione S-transferase family protein [Vibrio vulnificus]
MTMKLYIGNQNYSSWSLRAWVVFATYNLEVEVEKLVLFTPEFYQTLEGITPTAKVPTLVDGPCTVWDSLAILEYVNETQLAGKAWPDDRASKAKARALACEMHSGFQALRKELPMNCRAKRKVTLSAQAQKDVARIDQIWSQQMEANPHAWLFGEWSIADAMFAPVALRFETYQIPLSETAQLYQNKVLASAPIQRWLAEAALETDIVEEDEAGEPI